MLELLTHSVCRWCKRRDGDEYSVFGKPKICVMSVDPGGTGLCMSCYNRHYTGHNVVAKRKESVMSKTDPLTTLLQLPTDKLAAVLAQLTAQLPK